MTGMDFPRSLDSTSNPSRTGHDSQSQSVGTEAVGRWVDADGNDVATRDERSNSCAVLAVPEGEDMQSTGFQRV